MLMMSFAGNSQINVMYRTEVDVLPNSNMQRTYQIVVVQSKLLGLLLPAEDLTVFLYFLIFIQILCT